MRQPFRLYALQRRENKAGVHDALPQTFLLAGGQLHLRTRGAAWRKELPYLRAARRRFAACAVRPERMDVPAGKPLAFALHALPAGNLTFAGGIERGVVDLNLTLSLVMADDQAIWRDAGPSQLERMRRRAVGEQLFAAAKHDRHCEDAHSVDQVIGEQRVDELGAALSDEVWAVFLLQTLHVGDVAQEH